MAPAWHLPSQRWPAAHGSAHCALQDTKEHSGLGDVQGDRQSHGSSEEKQEALPSWLHNASKPGKAIPARSPLLTLSFIHHCLHHHGINLAVQVEAQLERDRGGLVRWSRAEPSSRLHLHGRDVRTHLLLAPLGGVDGVGGHTELLAHPPLVVHRLRLQAVVPGGVAVPWRQDRDRVRVPLVSPHPSCSPQSTEMPGKWDGGCLSLLPSQMPLGAEVRTLKRAKKIHRVK